MAEVARGILHVRALNGPSGGMACCFTAAGPAAGEQRQEMMQQCSALCRRYMMYMQTAICTATMHGVYQCRRRHGVLRKKET